MHRMWQRSGWSVLGMSLWLHISGCALLIAGAAGGGAAGTAASVKSGDEDEHGPATYAGTVLATVVYVPAKVVMAGLGAATSGASYVLTLGKAEPSQSIWDASVKGNYVLTPRMIEGQDSVQFLGA